MDTDIFQKIVDIVGSEHCSREAEEMHCYSYDNSKQTFLPDAVVLPDTVEQVAALVQLANTHRIPIVARGAGSGTTGGALPTHGGIVLSCTRLNRILEIDPDNQIAIVEPGVITGEFQQSLKRHKLMYAPDPASLKFCTMGGNVAECAGGPSAIKYGVTKDSIMGLEVVLANGDILTTGTRTEKGVVGYDLTHLFIGSEGTLGIITKIITRLLPLPEHKETFLLVSASLQQATELVATILQNNILPCTLEYMDKTALQLVSDLLPGSLQSDIQAMLIIEIDGSKQQVQEQTEQLKRLMQNQSHCTLQQATTEDQVQEIWQARRSISPASFKLSPYKTSEDVVVPRSLIPELVHFCEDLAKKLNIIILTFGHAGDGNIHVNIMAANDSPEETKKSLKAKTALFKKVLSMGGTLSGEHGVGITKSPFISLELNKTSITVMRQIKELFDKNNILNPGKIFPADDRNNTSTSL
jgi:glycolate dehydrogenase FAD-linked subunit